MVKAARTNCRRPGSRPRHKQALNRGNAEGLFARFKSQFPRWGTTYSGITLPEAALVAVSEVCPSGSVLDHG
jgi:hypothetical protein